MRRGRASVVIAGIAAAAAVGVAGCSNGGTTAANPQAVSATSPGRTRTTGDDAGRSDGSGAGASSSEGATATEAATASTTPDGSTIPPDATAGLDDLNQDGFPDPTCGTKDFGAGLVLRVPCQDMGLGNQPDEGATLVPGSLFAFPSGDTTLVADISGSVVQGRDPGGKRVLVFFINSDTLFDVGSSQLGDPAVVGLTGMARNIAGAFPGATVQVRGHTDSTGDRASNQTLSEQRARNVADLLGRSGIDPGSLSSVGLGDTQPIAVETNADGSANEPGRHEDRRVEVVVRPTS
jgi:outer membrane protein OmpA-like peptidoglycan-associated protein